MESEPLDIHDDRQATHQGPPGWLPFAVVFCGTLIGLVAMLIVVMFVF